MEVFPTVVDELAHPPGEEPASWDVLVWPDNVYTNPGGRILERTCNGTLEETREVRSLEGVTMGDPNQLAWKGHNPFEVLWPIYPDEKYRSGNRYVSYGADQYPGYLPIPA